MKKRYFIALLLTLGILYFTHHAWLGYKKSLNFDYRLFIILSTLGYMICLQITSYLADFKSIKNKSRIEIVFLTIFFTMLFIPMSHINQDDIAKSENRKLSKWHSLIKKDGEINFNFGKDYENWFNDRFALRKELVDLNYIYKVILNKKTETEKMYFYKDTNVVFSKGHIPKEEIFSKNDIKETASNLDKLNEFCKKNHIKLYTLIVPYNQYIYQQYAKDYANPKGLEALNNNIKELQKLSNSNIIYVYDDLKKASTKDFVAYKTDHHWSEYGAFIGYQRIMKEIQKDFPDIEIVNESDYKITTSKKVLNSFFYRNMFAGQTIELSAPFLKMFQNTILDTKYKYYTYKNKTLLETKIINIPKQYLGRDYFYPKGSKYKLLQMGTSMNENLLTFTPYTFEHTKYIRLNEIRNMKAEEHFKIMKYYKQEILDFKPDILIFCIVPGNFKEVNNIFLEDK